ncbi:MAG: O-antigen/teichoic acid export membrane protein [Phycisphaerales bacterium]|jgi:O-antigen/teichoic acid export membrane protein
MTPPPTSETRRGLARITTNYARLGLTLLFGLAQVPILYAGLGKNAFGLWGLLLSTAGIAGLFREVVKYSLNRELGEALHTGDPAAFKRTFVAAYAVCAVLTALAALLFLLLIAIVPLFDVPDHLVTPARWALAARGGFTCVVLALTPTINMLIITERMTLYNAWMTLERAAPLTAAVVLFLVLKVSDPAVGLVQFAAWSALGMAAAAMVATAVAVRTDRRLMPVLARPDREPLRAILTTGGWNTLVVIALNLHLRFAQIIMNIAFGLTGNAVFTIATQLTSYARMATVGMTDGLDAVAARLSADPNDTASLKAVARNSTRLHALVALPAALSIIVLVEPILRVWVAGRFEDPDTMLPLTVTTIRVLALGMAARAISDGWTRLLYGAGHVNRYAPLIAVGGLLNPVIAIGIIVAARTGVLPVSAGFYGPAIAYTAIFTVVHLFLLARIAARCLEESTAQTLAPIVRPLLVTAIASPALIVPVVFAGPSSWQTLAVALPVFAALFVPLAWVLVLEPAERQRFARVAGRLARRGRPAP